jgi:peroxiredoxin Q/BCP
MKTFSALAGAVALALSATAAWGAEELKVGDQAPDFKLVGSDGKTYTLSDFHGKQAVVVAWYPKAFTGG